MCVCVCVCGVKIENFLFRNYGLMPEHLLKIKKTIHEKNERDNFSNFIHSKYNKIGKEKIELLMKFIVGKKKKK